MIALPTNVQADQVQCEYHDGMLTVTLPKAAEARPRRIEIGGGGEQTQHADQAREVGQTQQDRR